MKILLLTDGIYPYSMGGMQKHSFYLAKYLHQEVELDVAMCVYEKQQLAKAKRFSEDFDFKINDLFASEFPTSVAFPGHYVFNSWKFSKQLLSYYEEKLSNYDIIYAQGFTAWAFFSIPESKRPPIISNLHGLEMYQEADNLKESLVKKILKIPANAVVKNSKINQSLGGKLTQILSEICPQENIVDVGIGIEKNWLRNSNEISLNNILTFAFIGRDEHRKGLHLLHPILEKLKQKGFKFRVNFIGPVPKEKQLEGEEYIYHGKVMEEEKVQQILDQSDVLLLPSLSEGMPTVILEAMSRGLAICATNVGAVAKMVDHENGILIETINEKNIEQAISSIFKKDVLKMKIKSLEKVKEFQWENVIYDYIKLFKSL
jgi:glycosyltransferase involved in cell wall biosynthesis